MLNWRSHQTLTIKFLLVKIASRISSYESYLSIISECHLATSEPDFPSEIPTSDLINETTS